MIKHLKRFLLKEACKLLVLTLRKFPGGNMQTNFRRTFARSIFLWSLAISTVFAREKITKIPDASNVKKASVALSILGSMTRKQITEQDMLKDNGCSFSTSNPQRISELVEILRTHTAEDPEGVKKISLRNMVYLDLTDGSRVKFFFGQPESKSNNVFGTMNTGKSDSYVALRTNTTLVNELRDWASELTAPRIPPHLACLTKAPVYETNN